MSKEAVMISENKKKIEMVKNKYKNMSMSDETAMKIVRLNTVNSVLKAATGLVGLVTVIDYFIPDPVLGLDEVALTAITGLLGYSSSLVDNKIDKIAASDDAELKMEEINNLANKLNDVAGKVKKQTPDTNTNTNTK